MHYTLNTTVPTDISKTREMIAEALQKQGFGILTEIDLKATFKKKLNRDYKEYLILGACNPDFAFEALGLEEHIGALLPCNICLIEQKNGTEVAIMDPETVMDLVENEKLSGFAKEVKKRLEMVLSDIQSGSLRKSA